VSPPAAERTSTDCRRPGVCETTSPSPGRREPTRHGGRASRHSSNLGGESETHGRTSMGPSWQRLGPIENPHAEQGPEVEGTPQRVTADRQRSARATRGETPNEVRLDRRVTPLPRERRRARRHLVAQALGSAARDAIRTLPASAEGFGPSLDDSARSVAPVSGDAMRAPRPTGSPVDAFSESSSTELARDATNGTSGEANSGQRASAVRPDGRAQRQEGKAWWRHQAAASGSVFEG